MGFKQKVLFFLIVSSLGIYPSCSKKTTTVLKTNHDNFKSGIVVFNNTDGCNWMIELEDDQKLQPVNLTSEFQRDQLKVWIRYEIKKGGIGNCMIGKMVTITEIELRKDE